mmetsp:Transcript_8987/g.25829  ORF Transcript_8987/g.25829 Transcript_8987/m.25829 type:complete len:243 (+) Transcript_8987:396-1124(+)
MLALAARLLQLLGRLAEAVDKLLQSVHLALDNRQGFTGRPDKLLLLLEGSHKGQHSLEVCIHAGVLLGRNQRHIPRQPQVLLVPAGLRSKGAEDRLQELPGFAADGRALLLRAGPLAGLVRREGGGAGGGLSGLAVVTDGGGRSIAQGGGACLPPFPEHSYHARQHLGAHGLQVAAHHRGSLDGLLGPRGRQDVKHQDMRAHAPGCRRQTGSAAAGAVGRRPGEDLRGRGGRNLTAQGEAAL